MNYWKGQMNWELNEDWKCPICGWVGLTWGLPHGTCRCDICHVQFRMRDEGDKVVSTPICKLKDEYFEPFKKMWADMERPIDKCTDADFDQYLAIATPK